MDVGSRAMQEHIAERLPAMKEKLQVTLQGGAFLSLAAI